MCQTESFLHSRGVCTFDHSVFLEFTLTSVMASLSTDSPFGLPLPRSIATPTQHPLIFLTLHPMRLHSFVCVGNPCRQHAMQVWGMKNGVLESATQGCSSNIYSDPLSSPPNWLLMRKCCCFCEMLLFLLIQCDCEMLSFVLCRHLLPTVCLCFPVCAMMHILYTSTIALMYLSCLLFPN